MSTTSTEFTSCFAKELGTISLRTARTKPVSGDDRYLSVVSLGQESKSVSASDIAATLDIAPEFSNIVSYTKDDFVYRDGRFYCANEDIPAGNWNGSKWTADPSLSTILLKKIRAIIPSTAGKDPGDVLTISSDGKGIEWAPGGSDITIDTVVVGTVTDQNNEAILDSNDEPIADSNSVELVEKINDFGILAARASEDVNGNSLALTISENKVIEIGGKSVGVVNDTDVTRWNSWVYASYDVPITGVTINGRKYPVVKIGNLLWMAENLDYRWTGLAATYDYGSSTVPRANYYNNDSATYGENGNKYGLLYNRPAAKYLEDHKTELGIPVGWRVPTSTDISTLLSVAGTGGAKIKSIDGWNEEEWAGTNETGFNLYPTGRRYNSSFNSVGKVTNLWTCTDNGNDYYPTLYIDGNQCTGGTQPPDIQYGIRLVKTLS